MRDASSPSAAPRTDKAAVAGSSACGPVAGSRSDTGSRPQRGCLLSLSFQCFVHFAPTSSARLHPSQGSTRIGLDPSDRLLPACAQFGRAVARHRRLEDAVDPPVGGDVRRILPVADRESRRDSRRRARSSRAPSGARPARRGGPPGTASAGCSPSRRRRRAARCSVMPASFSIAEQHVGALEAIASSAARAMCADVVPRVSPKIAPRAYASQCGAPRPANAGTR